MDPNVDSKGRVGSVQDLFRKKKKKKLSLNKGRQKSKPVGPKTGPNKSKRALANPTFKTESKTQETKHVAGMKAHMEHGKLAKKEETKQTEIHQKGKDNETQVK